jgi:hypothetical protein
MRMHAGDHAFEITREMIDVTSLSRPDTSWRFVDAAGHVHQWFVGDRPAERYDPSASYVLPTLHAVETGRWFDEEGEEHVDEEYRCVQCEAVVVPRTRADDTQMFIPGMARCFIDGVRVTKEEFDAAVKEAK